MFSGIEVSGENNKSGFMLEAFMLATPKWLSADLHIPFKFPQLSFCCRNQLDLFREMLTVVLVEVAQTTKLGHLQTSRSLLLLNC